jgi:hypothetical protein
MASLTRMLPSDRRHLFRIDDDVLIQKELPDFHPCSRRHLSTVNFIGHYNPNVMLGMHGAIIPPACISSQGWRVSSVWKLPYTYFVMSFDLDWVRSAEVQSIVQRFMQLLIASNRCVCV